MGSSEPGPAEVLGVAGAGTMGAGIAQVALAVGLRVILHDPIEGALERAAAPGRPGERGTPSVSRPWPLPAPRPRPTSS